MKKKNYTMRIAAGVMTAALLSTCAISSTFAKYTSESTGTDSARVAKWNIRINSESMKTATTTFVFDLFNTTYDSDSSDTTYDSDSSDTVKSSGTDNVIAPGTTGSFALVIENSSEVTATYAIDYTVTNSASIPVKFSVDGTTWTDNLANVTATALAMGSSKTITIQWKWDYEDTADSSRDENDTNLGTAGTDTLTVSAKVTATQVN